MNYVEDTKQALRLSKRIWRNKMYHYILAKYNNTVVDKDRLSEEAIALFKGLEKSTEGIKKVTGKKNIIPRDNRFDLMIVIEMDKEALDSYDHSPEHLEWKTNYAKYLEKKAIFDAEE